MLLSKLVVTIIYRGVEIMRKQKAIAVSIDLNRFHRLALLTLFTLGLYVFLCGQAWALCEVGDPDPNSAMGVGYTQEQCDTINGANPIAGSTDATTITATTQEGIDAEKAQQKANTDYQAFVDANNTYIDAQAAVLTAEEKLKNAKDTALSNYNATCIQDQLNEKCVKGGSLDVALTQATDAYNNFFTDPVTVVGSKKYLEKQGTNAEQKMEDAKTTYMASDVAANSVATTGISAEMAKKITDAKNAGISPMAEVICNIIEIIREDAGKGAAVLSIIGFGIAAMFGKGSYTQALIIIVGIGIVLGGTGITMALTHGSLDIGVCGAGKVIGGLKQFLIP